MFKKIFRIKKIEIPLRFAKAKELFSNVIQVGSIYLIALIFLFFSDIIFGRSLDSSEYGQLSFIRQTIIFLITFTFFGIDSSLVRIIGRKELSQYKWKKFVIQALLIFLILSIVISIIIKYIYDLSFTITTIIFISSLAGSGALVFSALLRANLNFFKAQLSTQFWKIILGFCSISLLLIDKLSFLSALGAILLSYIVNLISSFLFTNKNKEGSEIIPLLKVFSEGFLFWVNSGALILTSLADQLVIVKLLGFSEFAPYVATWNIVGIGYILASTSVGFVIVPPLIKRSLSISSMKKIILILIILSLFLSIFLYEFSRPIIKLAYDGKYESSTFLIIIFIIIGITRLIYIVPSTIITAWGSTKNIAEFSFIGFGGVILNILVAILLIPKFGIEGAAIGSFSGWFFRIILGFIQIIRINKREKKYV